MVADGKLISGPRASHQVSYFISPGGSQGMTCVSLCDKQQMFTSRHLWIYITCAHAAMWQASKFFNGDAKEALTILHFSEDPVPGSCLAVFISQQRIHAHQEQ